MSGEKMEKTREQVLTVLLTRVQSSS